MGVAKVVFSGPFSDPPRGLFPRLRAFTRRKHILLYFKCFFIPRDRDRDGDRDGDRDMMRIEVAIAIAMVVR